MILAIFIFSIKLMESRTNSAFLLCQITLYTHHLQGKSVNTGADSGREKTTQNLKEEMPEVFLKQYHCLLFFVLFVCPPCPLTGHYLTALTLPCTGPASSWLEQWKMAGQMTLTWTKLKVGHLSPCYICMPFACLWQFVNTPRSAIERVEFRKGNVKGWIPEWNFKTGFDEALAVRYF